MQKEIKCHDCNAVAMVVDGNVTNGVFLKYLEDSKEHVIFKCTECHAKNEALENFKPIEVYSRVVGYIRPVAQFNTGKQQEYKDRKEYKIQ